MAGRGSYSGEHVTNDRRRSVLRATGIAAGGLLLAGILILLMVRPTAGQRAAPKIGAALPNFTLTDLSGKQMQLSDYTGRPVLINAWATWCPPCSAEMPTLDDYYRAHRVEGFTVLAVNADEPPPQVQTFARKMNLSFPVLLDAHTTVLSQLGVRNYPTSIFVGRDGRVRKIHVGMLTIDQLDNEITPLLGQ